MSLCAFLGDELSALGFRLAGVECHCPGPEETLDRFRDLLGRAELIVATAEVAERLPADLLHRVRTAGRPLLAVIPDVARRRDPPDRADAVRRQLGMTE